MIKDDKANLAALAMTALGAGIAVAGFGAGSRPFSTVEEITNPFDFLYRTPDPAQPLTFGPTVGPRGGKRANPIKRAQRKAQRRARKATRHAR